jgi:hypothetical protein
VFFHESNESGRSQIYVRPFPNVDAAVKQEPRPVYMRPYWQGDTLKLGSTTFYVRTALDPGEFIASIPKIVGRLDPTG